MSTVKMGATVHERIYAEMKTMISTGVLAPGMPLQLRPLAAKLGVSKTPVIEAIRRLERDGLIKVIPKLGAMVKEWTQEELYEAYYIRRALESVAARLFVTRATPKDKDKLLQLNESFDRVADSMSFGRTEADVRLHLHIVRSCRYPHLYALVESSKIEDTLQYGFRGILSEKELSYKQTVGVHGPLVEALLGNDPERAEYEMKQHLERLLEMLRELEERNEEAELLDVRAN